MQIGEKYILKLLFSRFFAITLCASIFGIFQEMAKGYLLVMCTFWQMVMILPLILPYILFGFLPFILFGTLFLVLNELYSSNELISFKALGISNKKLLSIFYVFLIFVIVFFIGLALLYPATNKQFYKMQNTFGATNVLKALQPNKITKFGKYYIFFTDIDKNNNLNNVTIIQNTDIENNNTKLQGKELKNSKNVSSKQSIFNFEKMAFVYNNYDELIAKCENGKATTIKFEDKSKNKNKNEKSRNMHNEEEIRNKNIMRPKTSYILFSDFFAVKTHWNTRYRVLLQKTGFLKLLKMPAYNKKQLLWKGIEIHTRAVSYFFVLSLITASLCLLILRKNNRISATRLVIVAMSVASISALSTAFILQVAIMMHILPFYYGAFILTFIVCNWFILSKKSY